MITTTSLYYIIKEYILWNHTAKVQENNGSNNELIKVVGNVNKVVANKNC